MDLLRRWLAVSLLVGSVVAADAPPTPPDPLGLGERLALIDVLRESYGLAVEPGLSLDELRTRYATAWSARQPATTPADEQDRIQRLRRRITDRFGEEPPVGLDLKELSALHARLTAEREARDAAIIARRLAEPDSGRPASTTLQEKAPAPSAARNAPVVASSAASPAAAAKAPVPVKVLALDTPGVAFAALIDGPKKALCVQFGQQRSSEFNGVFKTLYDLLAAGKGPKDAVFLLGHGSGVSINGAPIGPHLRANKEFYETFGGTRPATRLECIVIASCSKGSPVQMSAMRDGFGYYPTWRVATADRCYANAISVLAAFRAIADRTADEPFRGIFRMGRDDDAVGSFGEVGIDGAKAGMDYFDIGLDGGMIRATER